MAKFSLFNKQFQASYIERYFFVKNNLQRASSVFASDLDSDGDVEILYSAEKGRIIECFINQFEDYKVRNNSNNKN